MLNKKQKRKIKGFLGDKNGISIQDLESKNQEVASSISLLKDYSVAIEKNSSTAISDIRLVLAEMVKKLNVLSTKNKTGLSDIEIELIDEIETIKSDFISLSESLIDGTPAIKDLLIEYQKEINQRINNLGGGAMNRQELINGVDVLKSFTDINWKAGTGITLTASSNKITKKTDITIDSSGGVSSVSNSDGTLTISPTTGAVIASRVAITGDISVPTTSNTATLPTINTDVGTFQGITVNGKGQVTAAANQGYGTGTVTSVGATSPITSSGGTTPTISTSMATNKLIGRGTAGAGVMEQISLGTGLSLSGTTLNGTASVFSLDANKNIYSSNTSLASLTTGSENFYAGVNAGCATTSGIVNIGIGCRALASNTCGNYNTASGYLALSLNTSGSSNIANGYLALQCNSTGSQNISLGECTNRSGTTGNCNIVMGFRALGNGINTGDGNVVVSSYSLYRNTTGSYNTASGYATLGSNTTGCFNIASGYAALDLNTTGSYNIALGCKAMHTNCTGSCNLAIGFGTDITGNISGATAIGTGVINTTTGTTEIGPSNTAKVAILANGSTVFPAPARLKGYTVATLPAGVQGNTAFVTDALAPAFLAVLVGGGAVVTPCFYNGAAWVGM